MWLTVNSSLQIKVFVFHYLIILDMHSASSFSTNSFFLWIRMCAKDCGWLKDTLDASFKKGRMKDKKTQNKCCIQRILHIWDVLQLSLFIWHLKYAALPGLRFTSLSDTHSWTSLSTCPQGNSRCFSEGFFHFVRGKFKQTDPQTLNFNRREWVYFKCTL